MLLEPMFRSKHYRQNFPRETRVNYIKFCPSLGEIKLIRQKLRVLALIISVRGGTNRIPMTFRYRKRINFYRTESERFVGNLIEIFLGRVRILCEHPRRWSPMEQRWKVRHEMERDLVSFHSSSALKRAAVGRNRADSRCAATGESDR